MSVHDRIRSKLQHEAERAEGAALRLTDTVARLRRQGDDLGADLLGAIARRRGQEAAELRDQLEKHDADTRT